MRFVAIEDEEIQQAYLGVEYSDGSIKYALYVPGDALIVLDSPTSPEMSLKFGYDCTIQPSPLNIWEDLRPSNYVLLAIQYLTCSLNDDVLDGSVRLSVDGYHYDLEDQQFPVESDAGYTLSGTLTPDE